MEPVLIACVPRASGDKPFAVQGVHLADECSPRQRG